MTNKKYFYTKDKNLIDALRERGIDAESNIPLFDLATGFDDCVYIYLMTEQLKKAIAEIWLEFQFGESDTDYSQMVY